MRSIKVIVVLLSVGFFCDIFCMHEYRGFNHKKNSDVVYQYRSDLHDLMTIEGGTNATLRDVALNIFKDERVAKAVAICQEKSIVRRLKYEAVPYPHIALARIVMTAFDGKWESYNIERLFCSSIDGSSALERMPVEVREILRDRVEGIKPYKGSPCRFAHSERGVGIYLMERLGSILANRSNGDTCLIQIKTSLPPCDDCLDFWNGCAKVSGYAFRSKGDDEGVLKDWLNELRELCKTNNIGVEITSQVKIEDTCASMNPPYFRSVNKSDYKGQWS